MTEAHAATEELRAIAGVFAAEITDRLHRVVTTSGALTSIILRGTRNHRVAVGLINEHAQGTDDLFGSFPLSIDNTHVLDLSLRFFCCQDSAGEFLAVDNSWMLVLPAGDPVPLFRYEYVRSASGNVPVAHFQIHAHRDEFGYALMAASRGKARHRWLKGKPPRLSEFHFPLGGHRFRPCLEDLLHAIVAEFNVDRPAGWEAAVREGREEWRRTQLKAAVRDAPADAAAVLDRMGYKIAPPDAGAPAGNRERLRAY